MRPKSFLILAVLTALSVGAAAVEIGRQAGREQQVVRDVAAFPSLAARSAEVRSVTVRSRDVQLTLTKGADGWELVERGGYPVDAGAIRKVLVEVAGLRLLEPRTSDPARYQRLFLRDVDEDGSSAKELVFKTASGEVLAGLLVGKRKFNLLSSGQDGTYIRKLGEAGSWLAIGRVEVSDRVDDWVEKKILSLDQDRVARVELRRADGAGMTVLRDDAEGYRLAGLGAGETVTAPERLDDLAGALADLQLNDVAPAGSIDVEQAPITAVYLTDDGLEVTVRLLEEGGRSWVALQAQAREATAQERAASLNAALAGWVFDIAPWRARPWQVKRADIVGPAAGS